MKKIENKLSVNLYAIECGVTVQAIHQRLKSGTLKSVKIKWHGHFTTFIDILKFPPEKLKRGRKMFEVRI